MMRKSKAASVAELWRLADELTEEFRDFARMM
jgi:hypothetical protein